MGNSSASVALQITSRDVLNGVMSHGVIPTLFTQILELNTGITDDKIDIAWSTSEASIAASTITSYDLVGTSLKNKFGQSVSFAKVVLIAIKNKRFDPLAYLDIGPHATNGFGRLASSLGFWPADIAADADQGSIVAPGGWAVFYSPAGVPAAEGVNDILRVTTSAVVGAINSWDILVLGRSA